MTASQSDVYLRHILGTAENYWSVFSTKPGSSPGRSAQGGRVLAALSLQRTVVPSAPAEVLRVVPVSCQLDQGGASPPSGRTAFEMLSGALQPASSLSSRQGPTVSRVSRHLETGRVSALLKRNFQAKFPPQRDFLGIFTTFKSQGT